MGQRRSASHRPVKASKKIDELIGAIYDAVLDPEHWPQSLEQIGDALGGASVILCVHDLQGGLQWAAAARVDPSAIRIYRERFSTPATNPFLEISSRLPLAEPVAAEAIVGPEHFTALEFYQHVLKPLKLRYSVSVTLLRDEEKLAAIAFLRSSEAGPFTAEELQILRAIAPHMQRALQLTLRLSKLETRSRGLFEALSAWRDGVVLVDGGGLAMFVNAAAGDILKCQYGLQLVKGRLAARDPVANAIFDRTLRSALANVEGAAVKGAQALVVPRAGDGGQYNVFVLPLRLAPALFSSQTPAALIVISESPSESAPGAEILLSLYGFSGAEACLAALLARGLSLKESAARLGVSLNTVKSHLKQLFLKTGTHRQVDLVRLLVRLPLLNF